MANIIIRTATTGIASDVYLMRIKRNRLVIVRNIKQYVCMVVDLINRYCNESY